MFRTLTALWRRTPAPTPSRATPVGEARVEIVAQVPAALLPYRTPGLATARRHTWSGVRHGLGALRDVDAWHGTESTAEARVREVAALQQIDTALAELAAAREALADITRKGRR
ncbi:hypothetical protein [Nocardiopsis synnemataformans]|uniref:hypothetical protein n=1 Tax=Nocardiopsis synnemataformans TaxID=61305 RepID=UPI003EB7A877